MAACSFVTAKLELINQPALEGGKILLGEMFPGAGTLCAELLPECNQGALDKAVKSH